MTRKPRSRKPASSFLEMRSRIVARYPDLSPQFQSIAQFALDNPESMAMETVVQLAGRLDATPSSFVRFAQALGYSGFAEMKRGFRDHLVFLAKTQDVPRIRPEGGRPSDSLRRLAQEARQDLETLDRDIDAAAFDRAVKSLGAASSIYVAAQHLSYPLAAMFAWSLIEKGKQCLLLDNVGGYALRQSALAGPDDATVSISFSPYQPSVVQEAKAHTSRGGTVIGITDTPLSPLAPHARELLIVPGMKPGAAGALSGALCLIRALADAVAETRSTDKSAADTRKPDKQP